jgi:hypothetical protein
MHLYLLQLKGFHVQFLPLQNLQVKTLTRPTSQGEPRRSVLCTALAALPRDGNLLYIQLRALDRRSLRHQLEPEGERRGDDLTQVADLHVHFRYPPPVGVAAGDLDHRVGYGELVQAR